MTLVALALLVAAIGLSGTSTSPAPYCPASWQTAPPTATPIKHLFVLIKENHAFENYFGGYPGAIGYPANGSFPVSFTNQTEIQPFPLTTYSTPDLPHGAPSDSVDYNNGLNNLFVAEASAQGAANPYDAVGYYTSTQLGAYYAYAHYYALGDRFFTGVLGPTYPNRVFDLGVNVGTWVTDSRPPTSVTSQTTVLDQLTAAGIPWYYDYSNNLTNLTPGFFPSLTSHPCSSNRIVEADALPLQAASADPPSVTYIDPSTGPYSEHPPENVTVGEAWTVAVVNSIFSSPIANSSAILIFYDENGGFWDPVPPPLMSTGLDGFRVPFLVLSPWTPAGTVCSTTLDPASVVHFIDENWGLPYLSDRVATASELSCFFNFSQAPRAPLLLPTDISLLEGSGVGGISAARSAS